MTRDIQTSFNAGEFSKRARDRSDIAAYFRGADRLVNVIPTVEGPAIRAPGTRFVGEVKTSTKKTRLIDFSKSTEDTIMIEAGDLYFRYWDGATFAAITSGGSPVETVTAISEAELDNLYWSQSADVMFITDMSSANAPYALRRFADDNWSLITYDIKFGPFQARRETGPTVTPSGVSGAITITSTGTPFKAGHVGSRLRLWQPFDGKPYDKWMPQAAVVAGELREYLGRVYESQNTDTTSDQPPVHEAGDVQDRTPTGAAVVVWRYKHELAGTVKVTAYNTNNSIGATVEEPLATITGTLYWAEASFSNEAGWPKFVGVYEGRLFFASTSLQPDTIFLSRTEGYNSSEVDFKQSAGDGTVEDDHAIVRTLADNEVNAPAWAIVDEQLIIGTARGLIRITGPSVDEGLTPAGARARRIPGTRPAGKQSRAIIAGDAIVYVSPGGRKVYEWTADAGLKTLNILAEHVGSSPIVEKVWCGEPYNRMYVRRADGRLFGLVYERTEGINGWFEIVPGGSFAGGPAVVECIRALKDAAGFQRLWMIVKRTIGGATKRFIEVMEIDWRADGALADDVNMMDAAIRVNRWNETATTVTVSCAPGSARGDAATIAASTGTPFLGKTGSIFRVRKASVPAHPSDAVGELELVIETETGGGSGATATLNTSPDADEKLINAPLSQWGFSSMNINNLTMYEGEKVYVQGDGMDLGEFTVSGGSISVGVQVMRAYVGLEKKWTGRSMPILRQQQDGTSRGRRVSARRAVVSMMETGAKQAFVRIVEDGRARGGDAVGARTDEDFIGTAPPIRDFVEEVVLNNSRADELQVEVYGGGALPATLRSIMVEYEHES